MMEKLSDETFQSRCQDFLSNYEVIMKRVEEAAKLSGRKAEDIHVLAATKTVPHELIAFATANGIQLIGENKAQELNEKYSYYQLSVENIHFIGHLQTNKVASVVGKVGMIQSVDSVRLAKEISKRSIALGITTNVLVEVNVGYEENKSGVSPEQVVDFLEEISLLEGICVKGLMTIPPVTETPDESRRFFSIISSLAVDIRQKNIHNVSMDYLSMGMSSDYYEAILEGANMVRIGSLLFGKRIYK